MLYYTLSDLQPRPHKKYLNLSGLNELNCFTRKYNRFPVWFHILQFFSDSLHTKITTYHV